MGFPLELVTGEGMRRVVGSDRFSVALVDRFSAGCDPARYLFGLAEATARAGAVLLEQAEVTAVEKRHAGFELVTGRGRLRAGQVLLATNGYTGGWLPALRRRVIPVGSYIVTTEPLPADTDGAPHPRRADAVDLPPLPQLLPPHPGPPSADGGPPGPEHRPRPGRERAGAAGHHRRLLPRVRPRRPSPTRGPGAWG